jgi:hypothetical protein
MRENAFETKNAKATIIVLAPRSQTPRAPPPPT